MTHREMCEVCTTRHFAPPPHCSIASLQHCTRVMFLSITDCRGWPGLHCYHQQPQIIDIRYLVDITDITLDTFARGQLAAGWGQCSGYWGNADHLNSVQLFSQNHIMVQSIESKLLEKHCRSPAEWLLTRVTRKQSRMDVGTSLFIRRIRETDGKEYKEFAIGESRGV